MLLSQNDILSKSSVLISTTLVFSIACLVAVEAHPQVPETSIEYESIESRPIEIRHTITFARQDLVLSSGKRGTTVRLPGCDLLKDPGLPMLPVHRLRLAIPAGLNVTGIQVAARSSRDLDGWFKIEPAQPPRSLSGNPFAGGETPADPGVYGSSDTYPGRLAKFLRQADLAGQSVACLQVFPVQYRPAAGKLTLFTSMEVVLTGVRGGVRGDDLPANISTAGRALYETLVTGMVANPQSVWLRTAASPGGRERGVAPGQYDYVIITQDDWVDDFQPLADWRTKRGTPAAIVPTSWIYSQGGYSGSDLEKVRAFVADAHANWGAFAFLLGGDSNVVPYHLRSITVPGYWTDDIPNDTYYADFDEDWFCEVNVGRAALRTSAHIATFVDKILTYEKNPPRLDYATTAAFFGFDSQYVGDYLGEICKEDIRTQHLPAAWTLRTEYDSEPGIHKQDVVGYLNQGHHLVNHFDHCNTDCMGVGYICHGELLYILDVNQLVNGDRQSILFAIGCWPADFPANSIGEALVKKDQGGCLAFIGNTRYGWGGPANDPDWYSIRQDRYFYRALFDEGHKRLGVIFSDLKNDAYQSYDPFNLHKYCFTQLTLLGDPEVPLWTADPGDLTVNHEGTVIAGVATPFTVTVFDSGNSLANATVCLWKEGDLYEVGATSPLGEVTFQITPATTGTMWVTATGDDFLPYEGQADVLPGGPQDPVPDIKVNGHDGPLSVPAALTVTITVSLDPGGQAGVAHDWWISATYNASTLYCWTYPGGWSYCTTPVRAYDGPLTNLSDFVISTGKVPRGSWEFLFAVDDLNNIYEGTYCDTVKVNSF